MSHSQDVSKSIHHFDPKPSPEAPSKVMKTNPNFGIYIHIPYCLQRCTYCDFATYEQSQILPPSDYFSILNKELALGEKFFPKTHLHSLYFGGGTPSLVEPALLQQLMSQIKDIGFEISSNTEVTIEINPATINPVKMEQYLQMGINRFSVGAQTFNDSILKYVHREHNAQQTRETLALLKSFKVNYSFDLLFALPGQDLKQLERDLDEVRFYSPHHVSPYCLTVPDQHPLARQRLDEDAQLAMFDLIHQRLSKMGYDRYEISNYAMPSFESRHNLLYWTNQAYWGIGLSAHSYRPRRLGSGMDHGLRFWNPKNIHDYQNLINERFQKTSLSPAESLGSELSESLATHQALTDFCHTSLRLSRGLFQQDLVEEFGSAIEYEVTQRLSSLLRDGLLVNSSTPTGDTQWRLTEPGIHLSNLVFEKLTFLHDELPDSQPSLP